MSFQTFVTQRLAAITAMMNAIATNAKKVDELPVQSILNPASKLHVSRDGNSESLEVQKIMDAISSGFYNKLLAIGEITKVDNIVTIPAGAQWEIDTIIYGNIADIRITIPYCATGLIRKDILVANTSNDIVLIQGPEADGISIRPNIPPNTVLVTEMNVSDTTIGDPSDPDLRDRPVSATESGIVNNTMLQELGGVDKLINGIRIGRGNGNSTTNLAVGVSALNSAQISGQYNGQFNPALGSRVLTNLTTGFYNVGVGHNALASNNGHENTAIGADAMSSNTTGFQNAGLGLWALYRNTTGYWNVGIGAGALAYNVMGNRNVAIGSNALINSNDNIAIGCNNLNHLTTGSGNVAIGSSAGAISGIITGDNNLTIAPNNGAATGITVGSGNVAIGKVTGLAANAENTVTIANGVGDIRFSVNTAGLATLPSATNALIAGDTTGKAAVTKEYIETNIKPYKIYISLLTQIGKNAPVAIVLENTLGGTVVWSRNTHGNYTGTLIGALTLNKTVGSVQSNNSNRPLSFSANHSANSFEISTNGADDILVNATIEVRVYN